MSDIENEDRGSTQNSDAHLLIIVVWPGEPLLKQFSKMKKYLVFENGHVLIVQKF